MPRQSEIIAGSDSGKIRIIRRCEIKAEIAEANALAGLCTLSGRPRFAYLLDNGTVGVYEKTTRLWRVRPKHAAECVQEFDITGDGVSEVLIGSATGKVFSALQSN